MKEHQEAPMAIWDKLKSELDRAGKAAQGALDEGKTRLEAFRARQQADKAAQALGYAVFRARQSGTEVDWQTLQRLVNALAEREAEVHRLEKELAANETKEPATTPPADGGA
jgi:predicted RNA-binding Zn ribbon-like protein